MMQIFVPHKAIQVTCFVILKTLVCASLNTVLCVMYIAGKKTISVPPATMAILKN